MKSDIVLPELLHIFVLTCPKFKARLAKYRDEYLDVQWHFIDSISLPDSAEWARDSVIGPNEHAHPFTLITGDRKLRYVNYNDMRECNPRLVEIYLGHVSAWMQQISYGYRYIVVLEDDAVLPEDFREQIRDGMVFLEQNYIKIGMLGTDLDLHAVSTTGPGWYAGKDQMTRSAHAYLLSLNGAYSLLSCAWPMQKPPDHMINELMWRRDMRAAWLEPGWPQERNVKGT